MKEYEYMQLMERLIREIDRTGKPFQTANRFISVDSLIRFSPFQHRMTLLLLRIYRGIFK